MTTDAFYKASEVDFVRGADALPRVAADNDQHYANARGEVLAVDLDRWQRAQQAEHDAWMVYNDGVEDARNHEWARAFDDYAVLPNALGNFVELGCGPFTNARLILRDRNAASVTLLDPLINDYLKHEHCPYRGGSLYGRRAVLVPLAIEDWHPSPVYDTLVMVNTLHHCRNVSAVYDRIWRALKPGGVLVWGEWPNETDPARVFDAEHPLTPRADTLETFLSQFEPLYRNGWFLIGRRP